MAGYHGVSDHTKIALFGLIFTSILHIIAYGAPYWTTRPDGNAGLWTGCTNGECYERWNQWVASQFLQMFYFTFCFGVATQENSARCANSVVKRIK